MNSTKRQLSGVRKRDRIKNGIFSVYAAPTPLYLTSTLYRLTLSVSDRTAVMFRRKMRSSYGTFGQRGAKGSTADFTLQYPLACFVSSK